MLFNFILNWILIPKYQAEGSAIASLATQSLIVILQIIVVKNVFGFKINYRFIGVVALYVCMILVLINGVKLYASGLAFQLFLFISISIILAIAMRIVNLKKMYKILVDHEL
jgi:O-antigen/teichoic acid export membrane protein